MLTHSAGAKRKKHEAQNVEMSIMTLWIKWKEWQSFPWSKLLYDISRFNINRHLDYHPLRILDVGGGNGFNSIYFAKQGYSVTLLDYSPEMLSEAKQAAKREGVFEKLSSAKQMQ